MARPLAALLAGALMLPAQQHALADRQRPQAPATAPATAPEDSALELMLRVVGQTDEQTRRDAACTILNTQSPVATRALLRLLESKGNEPAKTAVCQAIAEARSEDPLFVRPLLALLSEKDGALRTAAIAALATYRDPEIARQARAAIQEQDTKLLLENHAALMRAVYDLTPESDRPALLVAWLQQPLAIERLTAMDLVQQELRRGAAAGGAIQQIRGLLQHPDETVRQKAVLVLRTRGLREDSPRLEAMLKREPSAAVREAIYNALGTLGQPQALAAVMAGLDDSSPTAAGEAATALARLCQLQPPPDRALLAHAAAALLAKAEKADHESRLFERIIDAMGSLADRRFLPVLAGLTETAEASPAVRQAAIRGLGRIGDPAHIGLVTDRLAGDPDAGVRETAAEALGRLATRPADLQPLRERLDPKIEPATAVQARAWEAYTQAFARLPYAEQKLVLSSWESADPALAKGPQTRNSALADPSRRIDLLLAMEKRLSKDPQTRGAAPGDPAGGGTDLTELVGIREQLADAYVAASRPADASAALARGLEAARSAQAQRLTLKLIDCYLQMPAWDKAIGIAASLPPSATRDAAVGRLLDFARTTARTDAVAAIEFLNQLRNAVPDEFGPAWAAQFQATRRSLSGGSRPARASASEDLPGHG